MTVYRLTIHDDAGRRVDDSDEEFNEVQLEAFLATCDRRLIGRDTFYVRDGAILQYVSENV